MSILYAGLSALMYGAADFCGGMAVRRAPLPAVLASSQAIGLVVALAASLAFGFRLASPADLLWGALAGVSGAAGIAALYSALASTVVAVASPLAAVTGAVIPVLLGVAGGERPGAAAWVGMVLGACAIVLLTGGSSKSARGEAVRRAAFLGALAGLGFGLFFFAVSRTSHASGLWPLVAARVATVSLVTLFVILTRSPMRLSAASVPMVVLSGTLDMSANIAFLLASRSGMLSISAAVAALYPGPTVILAWIVLREKVTPLRVAGLALALAGVALISA
ncbi:MAG TPA: DMT family transporter [Spirochaetia bacterium]|nr:DMT family transporter [Spirochaetia bacterium]